MVCTFFGAQSRHGGPSFQSWNDYKRCKRLRARPSSIILMASSHSSVPPPHYDNLSIHNLMNIDATSREALRTNLGRVAGIASSMQLRDHVETTLLGADAERRGRLINMLIGPRGYEVGQHIQNLVLVECNKWLIDAPDAYVAMYLIAQRSRNLRLFHIGYNSCYLDWEMLPRRMQALLMRLMRQVRTVILEGIKNLPLALFYSLDNVQCLDLAMVKLAPMCPRYAIPPNSTPRPAPRSLTVHTRIAKEWKDDECDWTLDTVRYLKGYPSIRFNELRTLYLDFLGCSGCTKMWKEVVALCKDTLVSLKLNYSYEGNGELHLIWTTVKMIMFYPRGRTYRPQYPARDSRFTSFRRCQPTCHHVPCSAIEHTEVARHTPSKAWTLHRRQIPDQRGQLDKSLVQGARVLCRILQDNGRQDL